MNEDVGRMFTYGVFQFSSFIVLPILISLQITIEGDVIRLWYFSRSHSVVSEPVNYQEVHSFCLLVSALSHVYS